MEAVGLEVVQEVFDGCEDAVVVGAAGQDDVAGAPAFADQVADVGVAGVVGLDVFHATFGQQGAHAQGCGFGVAVDAAVDDHHALVFGFVAAPHVVLANKPSKVFTPHRSVQRADRLDVECGGLLEHRLYRLAIFAHDIGEIAAGIVEPFAIEVHLVGKDIAAQGPEGAEGVGGEERLGGAVVGHHHLGPVYHGRHCEDQRMCASAEGVALFDELDVGRFGAEELFHHLGGFGGGDHSGVRVAQQEVHERCRMVGFHVMHHHIVEPATVEGGDHVLEKLRCHAGVGGVEENGFRVQQQVAVVGHTAGDGIGIFEERQSAVAGTDIDKVVGDFCDILHGVGILLFMLPSVKMVV